MKTGLIKIEYGSIIRGGEPVIRDLELRIFEGEMAGCIVDDIREKEYILAVMRGSVALDRGTVWFRGQRIPIRRAPEIFAANIHVVSGTFNGSEELTVLDSFIIIQPEGENRRLITKELERDVTELLERFDVKTGCRERLKNLSVLDRVRLKICFAFYHHMPVVVLDNLSGYLNETDITGLMHFVEKMRRVGMSFLLLERDEHLLLQYADYILVIRDGSTSYMLEGTEMNRENLSKIFQMDEKTVLQDYRVKETALPGSERETVLEFRNVSVGNLRNLSFSISAGEILSILDTGAYDADTILRVLKGECEISEGSVLLHSEPFAGAAIHQAMKKGICFIDEEPYKRGNLLFYDMTVLDNLTLIMIEKFSRIVFRKKYERSVMREASVYLKPELLKKKVRDLTPAERQKVAYVKWLLYYPGIIVLRHPFAGTDPYMRAVTEDMLREYVKKGIAVLVITNNANESYYISDKILFMKTQSLFIKKQFQK